MIGVEVQSFVKNTVKFIILHLRITLLIRVAQSIAGEKLMFTIQNFPIMFTLKTVPGWKIGILLKN